MRSEQDVRRLLEHAQQAQHEAEVVREKAAGGGEQEKQAVLSQIEWGAISQTLRWVLGEVDSFGSISTQQSTTPTKPEQQNTAQTKPEQQHTAETKSE